MDLELHLHGRDATENTILGLQDWIRRERIEGLRVERKTGSPAEDQMGLDPGTILSIVLGSAAVTELVRSLHVWIQARRPRVKIRFKVGDAEIELDTENLPDQQATIDQVLALVKARGG